MQQPDEVLEARELGAPVSSEPPAGLTAAEGRDTAGRQDACSPELGARPQARHSALAGPKYVPWSGWGKAFTFLSFLKLILVSVTLLPDVRSEFFSASANVITDSF